LFLTLPTALAHFPGFHFFYQVATATSRFPATCNVRSDSHIICRHYVILQEVFLFRTRLPFALRLALHFGGTGVLRRAGTALAYVFYGDPNFILTNSPSQMQK
jgi:hypothetical protein